jgi:hypothetical protein
LLAPVLVVATCLATPHAFIYDLPMLTGAVLLYAGWLREEGRPLGWGAALVCLAVLVYPAVMTLGGVALPVGTPVLACFAVLLWREGAQLRR